MKATRRTRRLARKLFRLCMVDGHLDENRVRTIVQRVAHSNRRGSLPVLMQLQRLVRLDLDQRTARVESAMPLTDDVRRDVVAGLARLYGSGVATSFEQNPALIGGMRIKVGSDVYDGSVRTRLAALEARL
jgi:F-type H+-transporting ATPase subunit delta